LSSSLIDELQLDAANAAVPVSSLLRKALMVAAKLEVRELPGWINKELSGYRHDDTLPSYRILFGQVKGKIFGRWLPVQFPDNDVEGKITERRLEGSVADIEALLGRDGKLTLGFPAEAQQFLQELTGQPQAQFATFIERARLAAILDEIRNQVLLWAIALDRAGVKGEGLSFSSVEKERAHSIVVQQTGGHMTIGVVGSVSDHANVAAGIHPHAGSIDAGELQQFLAELRAHIPSLTLSNADSHGLQAAMAELDVTDPDKPVEAGKVSQALGRVLGFVGKAGQTVVTAGLKAYTEHWMKQHGLSP